MDEEAPELVSLFIVWLSEKLLAFLSTTTATILGMVRSPGYGNCGRFAQEIQLPVPHSPLPHLTEIGHVQDLSIFRADGHFSDSLGEAVQGLKDRFKNAVVCDMWRRVLMRICDRH